MHQDDKEKTRSLADLILEVAEPPGGVLLELFSRFNPPMFLAVGLLERCRLHLRGMCVLSDANFEHAGAGIARGVMEYSVTGSWLLRDPSKNLDRFLMGQRHELAKLVKERPDFQSLLNTLDQTMDDLLQHHEGQRLNDVASRMGPRRALYYQYRLLSERMHPTFVATMLAFEHEPDEGNLVFGDPGPERDPLSADYLFLATFWTWTLAADLLKSLDIKNGTLMAAGELLRRYLNDPTAPLMPEWTEDTGRADMESDD